MSSSVADVDGPDFEFDQAWYLQAYPDIAEAIKNGVLKSALTHYVKSGRDEGRLPTATAFDPKRYARAYPPATQEAGSADAHAMEKHYLNVGRFRGYLSN